MTKQLSLENDQWQLLVETLEEALDDAAVVLDRMIDREKVYESLQQFKDSVSDQQERIAGLQDLFKKLKEGE